MFLYLFNGAVSKVKNIKHNGLKVFSQSTQMKKLIKISIIIILISGVLYFINGVTRTHKMNAWQNKAGETLPDSFRIELPVIRNIGNWFCVRGSINDKYEVDFFIDTQANSLLKIETVNDLKSHYWGKFPAIVRNFYGQKGKDPLYYFDSFKIQSLSFQNPLFAGIYTNDAIYDIIENGVIGTNIIKQLYWKFSLDDDKMILFSKKDSTLLCKETETYLKIENGLNKSKIFFPDISTQDDFLFDLGYAGAIMVNKNIFTHLSELFSPQEYLYFNQVSLKNDTTYVFDNVDVEWSSIKISNCQIIYSPITNRNLIGAKLMHRFNFVLAYNEKTNNRLRDNLYIQPRNNFQIFKCDPYCSDFGFFIRKIENEFIIKGVEIGGLAYKAGIGVKDKIVSIDNGNFDLNDYKRLDLYLSDKESVILKIEKDGQVIDINLINK